MQIGIFFFENRFIFCINGINGKDDLFGLRSGIELKMDDLRTADRLLPLGRKFLLQQQFDQILAFQQDGGGLIDRLIYFPGKGFRLKSKRVVQIVADTGKGDDALFEKIFAGTVVF